MRLVFLALSLAACTPAPAPAPTDAGCPVDLTMGADTADGGFAPIVDGQDLQIVMGPQGGFHVFVGVQAHGVPRTGVLEWSLTTTGGAPIGRRTLDLSSAFLDELDCGWERRQDALVFIDPATVDQHRGQPAQLELKLGALTRAARVIPR
ncbi:MAG: hypothetical protein ACOZQL_09215 [Myxococcota bacterium]